MRRQARISTGGALVVRSASALQVWLWMLIFVFQNEFRISRSIQPGYLDFDNLPETNFTCAGKVIGGYYADLETSCQMFHVCTVGQQEEPMDIKFLCLNGTVFDQETRVCERVDEVDCTKSEKFYSLNLELYGSTAPPLIKPDQPKPQPTEHSVQQAKPNLEESDPSLHESSTKLHGKIQEHSTEVIDSTEDPIQEVKKEDPKYHYTIPSTQTSIQEPSDIGEEYQDEEFDDDEYEEDYSHATTTTTVAVPITTIYSTTTTSTTTTTTKRPTTSSILPPSTLAHFPISHAVSSPAPPKSSVSPTIILSIPISSSSPNLDPTILSPQEFIYHHRGPGSDAISFQRQSFRPADGVYITHAPPQQFDHFQYESSRTAPRPAQSRPSPFVQRPQPAPFRPTTLDPRDQLLRPGPTSQPSERHETSVKHRPQSYPSALPVQRPLPFNPYYYDRKRSDDSLPENESLLSARSVAPPTVTERPPTKNKSPPRVIVTASASVSDSNGKRLNYTVGNVVSAVKPIVPINYDDYKESDLIFDPFFLDVPKLQKRRKTRSNRSRKIFSVPATVTLSTNLETKIPSVTAFPATSRATTIDRVSNASPTTTTKTTTWNPYDYVDDNYEPHAYIPPEPPLAVLVAHDINKYKKQEIQPNKVIEKKPIIGYNSKLRQMELTRPTSSATQTTSSHVEGAGAAPLAPSPPSPPPIGSHSCASLHSSECQTHA